jgi:prefoldin alpha subunit
MASNKYEDQKQILTNMAEPSNKGQDMLIPLTQSLFIEGTFRICVISGTFENQEKVLVDYGTGYFVERSIEQAKDFSDRKIKLLKENGEKVTDMVNQKQK